MCGRKMNARRERDRFCHGILRGCDGEVSWEYGDVCDLSFYGRVA